VILKQVTELVQGDTEFSSVVVLTMADENQVWLNISVTNDGEMGIS